MERPLLPGNFYDRVYDRIAILVKECGSAAAFARVCGFERATVGAWTRRRCLPRADMVAMICAAMGVSSDWLLGLSNERGDE